MSVQAVIDALHRGCDPRDAIDRVLLREQIDAEIIFSPEEVGVATRTSRGRGAVGPLAVVPRVVVQIVRPTDSVLDFGAGKNAIHTHNLRSRGYNVTAYDFGANQQEGIHDKNALSRKYSLVFASNVLNVQSSESMLRRTLALIRKAVAPGGRFVANYPQTPRKANLSNGEMLAIVKEFFPNLERERGFSSLVFVAKI